MRPRISLDGSGGRLNSGDGGMRSMGGQQQQQQRGPGNFAGIFIFNVTILHCKMLLRLFIDY